MLGVVTVIYRLLAWGLLRIARGHWKWGGVGKWKEKIGCGHSNENGNAEDIHAERI
jgi:hypothetical protein